MPDTSTLAATLKRLASPRWTVREKGMTDLAALGRADLLLEYALRETVPAVLDVAEEALFPEPTELLIHTLTVVRGPDAALASLYHLPDGNYLYAESAITRLYEPRASRLPTDTIEGLGRAYIRSMAPSLLKQIRNRLDSLDEAKAAGVSRASAGVRQFVGQPDSEVLSGRANRSLEAAVAVRRLDHPLSSQKVVEMLATLQASLPDCPNKLRHTATLQWLLFDLGESALDELSVYLHDAGLSVLPDVATTLLKRGDSKEVDSLVATHADVSFLCHGFVFWPLLDYLSSCSFIDPHRYGHHRTQLAYPYLRALRLGLAPPPWWRWRFARA